MVNSFFVLNLPQEITEPAVRSLVGDEALVAVSFRELPVGTTAAMLETRTPEDAEQAMAVLRRATLGKEPLVVLEGKSPMAWQVAALFSSEKGEQRACGMRRSYEACLLLVDDDPMCRQVMQRLLSVHLPAVCVHLAGSGQAALTLNRTREFDAILSDVQMPGLSGVALAAEIQRLRPDTPVVLMTGSPDVMPLLIDSGAFAFLRKPVNRQYCVIALQHALAYSSLRKSIRRQQITMEARRRLQALTDVEQQESIRQWNLVPMG